MISFIVQNAPPVIYFFCIVFVVLLSLTGKAHVGLLFLVPLFPLRNVVEKMQQFPMGKDIIDIILFSMIVGWMIWTFARGKKLFDPSFFNALLIVMVMYTYVSLWRSSYYLGYPAPLNIADIRVQHWKNYMIFPLLFFLVFNNIKNEKHMRWLVISMMAAMVLMDYYLINQLRWMSGIESRDKIDGTFVSIGANELAAFYASYTFVLFGIFLCVKKIWWRLMLLPLCILNFGCMIFLYSRGAYIAMLAGLATLGIMKSKKYLVLVAAILIAWQVILPKNVIERINQTKTSDGTVDVSVLDRIELWRIGMYLYQKHFIAGVGFGVIPVMGLSVESSHIYTDTHNIYVRIAAEQGTIGLVLLLLLFWFALKSGWKLYRNAHNDFLSGLGIGFVACTVTLMTANIFGNRWTHLQVGAFFWVFLALVERGNLITDEEGEPEES